MKIDIGAEEYDPRALPCFVPVSGEERDRVVSWLHLSLATGSAEDRLYQNLQKLPKAPGIEISDKPHEISRVLRSLGLKAPETVYVCFSNLGIDDIDRVPFEDLDRDLSFYWYPIYEDMIVVSMAPPWLLLVLHFGAVLYLVPPNATL